MAAFRVLEGFVFAFFDGLADASTVVVGKEVGAGHHMKGYQYVKGFSDWERRHSVMENICCLFILRQAPYVRVTIL